MAIQNQPGFIPAPFANSGTKNVIPENMPTPSASAAASWTDGFPTVCSLPLASGGIPPARADFNGLFNSITQAQAFYQSGGVYEWDATVDYGTNRMVLGSDGKLYWSMAQSGPNTGAGAVDPTTDDGTYWGSVPMNAPGLGDKSDKVATTEWVKDLAATPVYVDPAGDDTNDGMSQSFPVKTLAKAFSIADNLPQPHVTIVVAGGTYSGDVSALNQRFSIRLDGNVTINGSLNIGHHSNILFYDDSDTFSLAINSTKTAFSVESSSSVLVYVPCSVTVSGGGDYTGVDLRDNSYALFHKTLGVSCVIGSGVAMVVYRNSCVNCEGQVTVTGSVVSGRALDVDLFSTARFKNGLNASSYDSAGGLSCDRGSYVVISSGDTAFKCKTGHGIYVGHASNVTVENTDTFSISCSGTGVCIGVYESCFFGLSVGSGKTALIEAVSSESNCGIYTAEDSYSILTGDGTITFNGSYYRVTRTTYGSLMYINTDLTLNGNATGQRYDIYINGVVGVGGAGTNRIPGSIAGYNAGASQLCYYN